MEDEDKRAEAEEAAVTTTTTTNATTPEPEEEAEEEDVAEEEEEEEQDEDEDLRHLILEQLATMEPSDISDEEGYQVRLSCILEDDESESSASTQHNRAPKSGAGEPRKTRDKGGTSEEGESESSEDIATLRHVQVTDLDEDVPGSRRKSSSESPEDERTEVVEERSGEERDEGEDTEEEESGDGGGDGAAAAFEMQKLKSSDNVHLERRLVPKRTEFSSDSSDIDISISNERASEVEGESPVFAKVSRTCVERARSREADEPADRLGSVEREMTWSAEEDTGADPKRVLQVVHLRSKSPRVYTPPVPPETYLWEELKRIRGKGGYPWTYLDKPPFDEVAWKKYMEHEYEPINPPPLSALRKRQNDVVEDKENQVAEKAVQPSEPQKPRQEKPDRRHPDPEPVKSKEEKQLVVEQQLEVQKRPLPDDEKTAEDMEVEDIARAEDLQREIENRFLAQTPTTTTASRTDGDVNTSMLDSSGLEDVPLKRASRSRMKVQAHGLHQKLRTQAGKLKNRLKSMPKPSLAGREGLAAVAPPGQEKHPRRFKLPEKPKFNFPERAKFTLPERPKFKLPEKAKFTLPDRPKFNLPERPKIHLPERPKLHLPERPKLHFPERPKFNLPERPKIHLPERPKFNLPEMSKFHLPERPKLHLPERPKLHLPERPKINLPSFVRPLRERQDNAVPRRKNIFDMDFKSYPKIFSKKSRQRCEYTTSSPKKTRGITPPPKMRSDQPSAPERKKVPVGQRWIKKMDDIKYADDEPTTEVKESRRSERSESLSDFHDKDLGGYMEDLDDSRYPAGGRKTLSTKSSVSHASDRDVESLASSEGRRKGVLEEIDSDEFFLRQKGISQEDIDMGKYLSREIREAFRSPEVNALARMSFEEAEPSRPTRARSFKKKTQLKKQYESDPALSESSGYKTYPPRRPDRKSRSQSKSLVNEEAIIAQTEPTYENEPYRDDEDNVSEYYKTPGPAREYEHYKVPRPIFDDVPVPQKRKKSGKKKLEDVTGLEMSIERMDEFPPQPLTRRKSKKKLSESTEERMSRGEDEDVKPREEEERVQDEPPVAPRRTRSLSRGSRSIRSSRSLRSVGPDDMRDIEPHVREMEAQILTHASPTAEVPKPHHYETADDDPGFGYATIGKPTVSKPVRQKDKPERPPPPRRKKVASLFNTVPRRTPVRPMRNYSTLGPSRPPRKSRLSSIEQIARAHVELENESVPLRYEECFESSKDLQKDEVIEKMKGRPLPPPPRPPRQKSRGPEDVPETVDDDETKISMALLRGEDIPVEVEVEALVHAQPRLEQFEQESPLLQTTEAPVEEVCVSTQTDPLPDDFLLDVEDDVIQEFSHEQLKIQQAFMEDMKKEAGTVPALTEEEKRVSERLEMELLAELQREAQRNRDAAEEEKKKKEQQQLEPFDVDLGYSSLDRRHRQQEQAVPTAQPIHVPVIPDIQTSVQVLRTEKLDVKELDVERLNVREVQAQGIQVSNLQTGQLTADEVRTRSGNLSLGSIELPPNFIQQIVDKIPWQDLKQEPVKREGSPYLTPARRQRRHRRTTTSSDDEEDGARPHRRHVAARQQQTQSVGELTRQLAAACVAYGIRTIQSLASRVQSNRLEDRALVVRIFFCLAIVLIAGIFLYCCDRQTVLHHHWDFQFPPQPPPREL